MNGRRLLVQGLLAGLVVAAANAAVARFAANSVPRQQLKRAEQAPAGATVFLGNSTIQAGIDESAYSEVRPLARPVNLGLGSSTSVEHLLLLRRAVPRRPAVVYYGFFDTQLTEEAQGDWSTLAGNRAMNYYVEPEYALKFYCADSYLNYLLLRSVSYCPMAIERLAIWAKVEKTRRWLGGIGVPPKRESRFGRADDFARMEAREHEIVSSCRSVAEGGKGLASPIRSLIKSARQVDAELVFVLVPMSTSHRRKFYALPLWKAYVKSLDAMLKLERASLIDASDWMGDDQFSDGLHLSEAGAAGFSKRLAKTIPPID